MNIIRPAAPGTGPPRAVGEAIQVGRLVDAAGRLSAQGPTTCRIFDF